MTERSWEETFAAALAALEKDGRVVKQLDICSPHDYFSIDGHGEFTASEVVDAADRLMDDFYDA